MSDQTSSSQVQLDHSHAAEIAAAAVGVTLAQEHVAPASHVTHTAPVAPVQEPVAPKHNAELPPTDLREKCKLLVQEDTLHDMQLPTLEQATCPPHSEHECNCETKKLFSKKWLEKFNNNVVNKLIFDIQEFCRINDEKRDKQISKTIDSIIENARQTVSHKGQAAKHQVPTSKAKTASNAGVENALEHSVNDEKTGQRTVQQVAKELIKASKSIYSKYSQFYFDRYRRKYAYVMKVHDEMHRRMKIRQAEIADLHVGLDSGGKDEADKLMQQELEELIEKKRQLDLETKKLKEQFHQQMDKVLGISKEKWPHVIELALETNVQADFVTKKTDMIKTTIEKHYTKLTSLYNNKGSAMEVFLDTKFLMMYVLKIVTFAALSLSLLISEKIVLEMYMKKVYAKNADPPSIVTLLGVLLGFMAMFLLFIFTVLILIMYIFGSHADDFIINSRLLRAFAFDLVVYLVLVIVLCAIIGSVIETKKYFRYKTEGLRAIRAYKNMIWGVAGILILIPFFAIF